MPALGGSHALLKWVSSFPGNPTRGLPTVSGVVLLSDAETGELVAIDLKGGGAGGIVAPMLSFRLEPAARRRATERALNPAGGGLPSESLRELGRALEPGASVVAVLVEHRWTRAVEDAVTRTGGTLVANEHVDSTGLAQHIPELLAAARTGVRRPARAGAGPLIATQEMRIILDRNQNGLDGRPTAEAEAILRAGAALPLADA